MLLLKSHKTKNSAFTLVEMLVAIAITVIMLGFIWEVFYQTRQVVSRGIQTTDVIATNRTISSQLEQDFTGSAERSSDSVGGIVSPWANYVSDGSGNANDHRAGFLVIVNRTAAAAPLKLNGTNSNPVRDDQLCFIEKIPARSGGVNQVTLPLVPDSSDNYGPNPYATAKYAKVWYGHVLKTLSDGQRAIVSGTPDELGLKGGQNFNAYNWILGRQAVFMMDFGNPNLSTTAQNSLGASSHAQTNSSTVSALSVSTSIDNPLDSGRTEVYKYPTDLADIRTFNYQSYFNGDYPSSKGLFAKYNNRGFLYDDMSSNNYRNVIFGMMYLGETVNSIYYPYLWVNPHPQITNNGFQPWQIAQMAPIFAQNVSDFCVDFAGDYGTNNVNTGDFTAGNRDGKIDRDDSGNIIWYSGIGNTTGIGTGPYGTTYLNSANPDTNSILTSLIDDTGHHPIYYSSGGTVFIFRHDDANIKGDAVINSNYTSWPWLLRIRYRIHDYNGRITSKRGTVPGRWFSIIVPLKH